MSEKPQALRDDWKNQSLRIAEREMRAAIIEECARHIEFAFSALNIPKIAASIRALKDNKP